MKIFITGIAGFLGSRLADYYLNEGYSVAGCDNLSTGLAENLRSEIEFFQIDCLNTSEMTKAMSGCDLVVHAACLPYEGVSIFSPNLISLHTYQASVSVFTACANAEIKKVIFCSSMARYGANPKVPFSEELEPCAVDPYGVGKVASEQVLKIMSEVYGFEYTILVPHNIIGRNQRYNDPYRNVCAIMINAMLLGKQPVIFGDGLQKRCFTDVRDILPLFLKCSHLSETNKQIINIGPDEGFVSILDLAKLISKVIGFKNFDPVFKSANPIEVKNAYCKSDKSRKLLGYSTKYSLEESLQDMAAWIAEKGPRKFEYLFDLEIVKARYPNVWASKYFE